MRARVRVLLLGIAAAAAASAPTAGAAARDGVVIHDGPARFEVLSPTLIRLEYAEDRNFENSPTLTAARRGAGRVAVTTRRSGRMRVIRTSRAVLRYRLGSGPFGPAEPLAEPRGGRQAAHRDPGVRRRVGRAGGYAPAGRDAAAARGSGPADPRQPRRLVPGPRRPVRPGPAARRDPVPRRLVSARRHDQPRCWSRTGRGSRRGPTHDGALPGWLPVRLRRRLRRGLRDFRDAHRPGAAPAAQSLWELVLAVHVLLRVRLPRAARALSSRAGSARRPRDRYRREVPELVERLAVDTALFGPDPAGFFAGPTARGSRSGSTSIPRSRSRTRPLPPASAAARRAGPGQRQRSSRAYATLPRVRCAVFDWARRDQAAAYFDLHAPFESQGVDFWWLDWNSDESDADGTGPDARRLDQLAVRRPRGRARPPLVGAEPDRCPRFWNYGAAMPGVWAEHRNAIHFTGDAQGTWDMLDFEIRMTTAEGAGIGLPYVSHDIGSFQPPRLPPDLYVRWVQFGAFQPILRLHSDHGDRLPWEYGGRAERIASGFLRLREALVPYLYTTAREAYDTGLPIARPMYLDWPRSARAYRYDSQYMLGDELLVAPVAAPGTHPTKRVWFPPGRWVDVFTGEVHAGDRSERLRVPLDRMPVFARMGAIVAPPAGPEGSRRSGGSAGDRRLRRGRRVLFPLRGRRGRVRLPPRSVRAHAPALEPGVRDDDDRTCARALPGHAPEGAATSCGSWASTARATSPSRPGAGRVSCTAGHTTLRPGGSRRRWRGSPRAASGWSSAPTAPSATD